MENDKYYTPKIDEFHVGFECELRNSSHPVNFEWEKFKIIGVDDAIISNSQMDWSFYDSVMAIRDKAIRVKYLDAIDIENAGWEKGNFVNIWSEDDNIIDGYCIVKNNTDNYVLFLDQETMTVGIYLQRIYNEMSGNWESIIMFSGFIQNKSELIKIMEMLGIK